MRGRYDRLFWLSDRGFLAHLLPLKKQESQTRIRTSQQENKHFSKKLKAKDDLFPCLLRGQLPWLLEDLETLHTPSLERAVPSPRLLLLSCSRWDQQRWTPAHGADGKAERLSWGFWLTTSNFLGWCQSTALSVLVGSAALTGWTKAQASKGQLLIYAHWTYNLRTTRTNTALQGQTLLLGKHEASNTECMSLRWLWARPQKARACTEKGASPPLDTTQQTWLCRALLLHGICCIKREKFSLPARALQDTLRFREQSSCTDTQPDGSSKPLWKSCTINRERLDPTFMW